MYDWDEYLTLALNILENNNLGVSEETRARIAISRSYYAVFHNARLLCENRKEFKDSYDQGGGEHDKIYNKLRLVSKGSSEFKSQCHSVANTFNLLKSKRHEADYESNICLNLRIAELNCKKAQRLIEQINRIKCI